MSTLGQGLAQELEFELGTTRRLLERLPEDKWSFQPHAKSMTLGQLANHIAEIPGWGAPTVKEDVFAWNTGEFETPSLATAKEIVARFDSDGKQCVEAIAGASDEAMGRTWKMVMDGREVISMPRFAVLKGFILKHLIHHRAQLGVYLRMCDVALPQVYGPTADEPDF